MYSKLLSLRTVSAEERGDSGYAGCPSRRISHKGPDVSLLCCFLSLIKAAAAAVQHTVAPSFSPVEFLFISRHASLI